MMASHGRRLYGLIGLALVAASLLLLVAFGQSNRDAGATASLIVWIPALPMAAGRDHSGA